MAKSSAEAEYRAVAFFLGGGRRGHSNLPINPSIMKRHRVEVDCYFTREKTKKEDALLIKVNTENQLGDFSLRQKIKLRYILFHPSWAQ